MSRRVDIREFARLLKHTEAPFAGQPFIPEPWQDEYLDRLFNTKRPDGKRQYQRSLLALARKQGKTALSAVIGAYEAFFGADGGQILIAAGDRKQASLLFTACSRYIESCPGLHRRCKIYKQSIVMPHNKSTIQFLSSEHKGKHGFNPSVVIVDEFHVQKNRDLIDVLESAEEASYDAYVLLDAQDWMTDPVLNLLQWVGEPADPQVYAQHVALSPRDTYEPRNVLMMQGIADTYILPAIANALSLPLGVALLGESLESLEPESAAFDSVLVAAAAIGQDVGPLATNATANIDARTSALLVQYQEDGIEDGHEVVFQLEAPKRAICSFLRTLARGEAPSMEAGLGDCN
jgi:hypothetical protein